MLRQADEVAQEVRAGGYAPADAVRKPRPPSTSNYWSNMTAAWSGPPTPAPATTRKATPPTATRDAAHHARCIRACELWSAFTKVRGQGDRATEPPLRAYDGAACEAYERSFRRR